MEYASEKRPERPEEARRVVSMLLRDDSMLAATRGELEAYLATVQVGATLTKLSDGKLYGKRESERYVAVCPHTSRVFWMKPPNMLWASDDAERPDPARGTVDEEVFQLQVAKLAEYKSDTLVGVLPATQKHVSEKYRERAFLLAMEQNELLLVAQDPEARRVWVAACSAVSGRMTAALLGAGMQAVESRKARAQAKEDQAQAKVDDLANAEAEAVRAKLRAEEEGEAAKKQALAEGAAARAAAQAEADAAKARAQAEADAAKARAQAEADAAKARAQEETAKSSAEALESSPSKMAKTAALGIISK